MKIQNNSNSRATVPLVARIENPSGGLELNGVDIISFSTNGFEWSKYFRWLSSATDEPGSYTMEATYEGSDRICVPQTQTFTLITPPSDPDLTVTASGPAAVIRGNSYTYQLLESNNTAGPAGAYNIRFWWLDGSSELDVQTRSRTHLDGNESDWWNERLTVPSDITLGPRKFCARIDSLGQVDETNETNNTSCMAVLVDAPLKPDLTLSKVSVSPNRVTAGSDAAIVVSFRVSNTGKAASGKLGIAGYFTNDEYKTGDRPDDQVTRSSLAAGESRDDGFSVILPDRMQAGQPAYLCLYVNWDQAVSESEPGNNIDCADVTIDAAGRGIVFYVPGIASMRSADQDFRARDRAESTFPVELRDLFQAAGFEPAWYSYRQSGSYQGENAEYSSKDTRQRLAVSAQALEEQIHSLRTTWVSNHSEASSQPGIVIVAHSLGGAVAARWASKADETELEAVRTVFTFDSPLAGVGALRGVLGGDAGKDLQDSVEISRFAWGARRLDFAEVGNPNDLVVFFSESSTPEPWREKRVACHDPANLNHKCSMGMVVSDGWVSDALDAEPPLWGGQQDRLPPYEPYEPLTLGRGAFFREGDRVTAAPIGAEIEFRAEVKGDAAGKYEITIRRDRSSRMGALPESDAALSSAPCRQTLTGPGRLVCRFTTTHGQDEDNTQGYYATITVDGREVHPAGQRSELRADDSALPPEMYSVRDTNNPTLEQLARYWAPVIYQDVDRRLAEADYIVGWDYDGDKQAANNWENLTADSTKRDLGGVVYWWAVETESHWFIGYGLFHPRDWGGTAIEAGYRCSREKTAVAGICHENDLEGVLLSVSRDDGGFGKLVAADVTTHWWANSAEQDSIQRFANDGSGPAHRPVVFAESAGHALHLDEGWREGGFPNGDGIVYYPTGRGALEPQEPDLAKRRSVGYRLVDISGLWTLANAPSKGDDDDRRHERDEVFEPTSHNPREKFQGDDGSEDAATLPWGWSNLPRGVNGEVPQGSSLWFEHPYTYYNVVHHDLTTVKTGASPKRSFPIFGRCNGADKRADLNKDCKVNILDMVTLVRSWGMASDDPEFDARLDLNGNGRVDIFDMVVVAQGMSK